MIRYGNVNVDIMTIYWRSLFIMQTFFCLVDKALLYTICYKDVFKSSNNYSL